MFPIKIKRKAKKVFELCLKKNIKLAFAESCTGGLLSALITSFPDSSKVFKHGCITYSNLSKQKNLNIKKKTLNKYGAVSEEVAKEMVNGIWKKNNVDIALSITGIAGPSGGSKKKKVGLVYIGVKNKKKIKVNEFNIKGNREKVRLGSIEKAIDLIKLFL
tara:strand:- start:1262 stop:1744 length:483 start_codon:yes stop_codon:yes gene_type:complete